MPLHEHSTAPSELQASIPCTDRRLIYSDMVRGGDGAEAGGGMKRVHSEKHGDAELVIAGQGTLYKGVIYRSGKPSFTLEGMDLELLKAQLRNELGRLHPNYVGFDGAKKRFLRFFPHGFSDNSYLERERGYKDKARAALIEAAPVEAVVTGAPGAAVLMKKGLATNLLSRFEAARIGEVLASKHGAGFAQAAAAFTSEPTQSSLAAMEKAIKPYGHASWPMATYFPFLWAPQSHMFLKPEATIDFAERTGDPFPRAYSSALDITVYGALLKLASRTEQQLAALKPRDRIDVQSFIWVVGSYTDDDG